MHPNEQDPHVTRKPALPWHGGGTLPHDSGDLMEVFRREQKAALRGSLQPRCKACGKTIPFGMTVVTDGVDHWHPEHAGMAPGTAAA